ncbi:MAG TPA: DUF1059 domain-containing protein [Terriglobia bacterium]|nr:DUF1059 domain-containing protein [Terriglobia bacterium]
MSLTGMAIRVQMTTREKAMSKNPSGSKRKMLDCRQHPSTKDCSVTITGTEDEVMTVGVRHAVNEHGHQDTPELRQQLKGMLKDAA